MAMAKMFPFWKLKRKSVYCPSGEQVVNGGFENDFTGWAPSVGAQIVTDVKHSGLKSCLLNYSCSVQQSINILIDCIESFKGWVKKDTGIGNTYFTFSSDAGGQNSLLTGGNPAYDWTEEDLLARMITAGAYGTLTLIGFVRMSDYGVNYWFDDISLICSGLSW